MTIEEAVRRALDRAADRFGAVVADGDVQTDGTSLIVSCGHERWIRDDDIEYSNPDIPAFWVHPDGVVEEVFVHVEPQRFDGLTSAGAT